MTITLTPDAGLAANTTALGAFQRAANTWSNLFADPINVNINAGLAALASPTTIGSTNATFLSGGYTTVRNAVVNDAADEPGNAIVASLPTAVQFSAFVPAGFGLSGAILLTSANAKALGFTPLVATDGTITFNSLFSFDYDNSDGVGAGLIDFETVALHEIGHVLGFISAVDTVDALRANNQTGSFAFTTLDLFRFNVANNPTTAAQFTTNTRSFVPGAAAVFSDSVSSWAMSTGVATGDGHQASHWKDDGITGNYLGVMDPTLPSGVVEPLTFADMRAFDLIGYELVPEPATYALVGLCLAAIVARRKRT